MDGFNQKELYPFLSRIQFFVDFTFFPLIAQVGFEWIEQLSRALIRFDKANIKLPQLENLRR